MLTFSIFICLFGVFRPIRKFFTNMETSPLPVKGCKFWPCHPYCQCTIIILSSEELVLLKHNSFVPLSVAFEEQQKPHEPQHLLCLGRQIIISQGYLTLTVLVFRSRARIRIPGLVKTWLLVVLEQVFIFCLVTFAAILYKLIIFSKFILSEVLGKCLLHIF